MCPISVLHKNAIDGHQCWEYVDCTGRTTKQKKSTTIGKGRAHYLREKPLLGGQQELDDWIKKKHSHGRVRQILHKLNFAEKL